MSSQEELEKGNVENAFDLLDCIAQESIEQIIRDNMERNADFAY